MVVHRQAALAPRGRQPLELRDLGDLALHLGHAREALDLAQHLPERLRRRRRRQRVVGRERAGADHVGQLCIEGVDAAVRERALEQRLDLGAVDRRREVEPRRLEDALEHREVGLGVMAAERVGIEGGETHGDVPALHPSVAVALGRSDGVVVDAGERAVELHASSQVRSPPKRVLISAASAPAAVSTLAIALVSSSGSRVSPSNAYDTATLHFPSSRSNSAQAAEHERHVGLRGHVAEEFGRRVEPPVAHGVHGDRSTAVTPGLHGEDRAAGAVVDDEEVAVARHRLAPVEQESLHASCDVVDHGHPAHPSALSPRPAARDRSARRPRRARGPPWRRRSRSRSPARRGRRCRRAVSDGRSRCSSRRRARRR